MSIKYEIAYHTDQGLVKAVNQDSICIKVAETAIGMVCMAVLCDGMGGLQAGEWASSIGVYTFSEWFDEKLVSLLSEKEKLSIFQEQFAQLAIQVDKELKEYETKVQFRLGTTMTAILFVGDSYVLLQVGDSRAYEIGRMMRQLTDDQSYVNELIKKGMITKEEAKHHPKRNILTQCLGGVRPFKPIVQIGKIEKNANYLLCCDGFVHEVEEEILEKRLRGWKGSHHKTETLTELTNAMKEKGEQDNITSILVHCENNYNPLFLIGEGRRSRKLKNKIQLKTNILLTDAKLGKKTTETMEGYKL